MEHKCAGNRFFQTGEFQQAKQCYTEGLGLASTADSLLLAQLHSNRAAAHFHLKELAEAKKDAKCAAELAPHWAKPHLRLAEVYFDMGRYHKAANRLEEALGIATAACDAALVKEIKQKLPEYRLLRAAEGRGERENLAYSPMRSDEGAFRSARQAMQGQSEFEDPNVMIDNLMNSDLGGLSLGAEKHVVLDQLAMQDCRLLDEAREFKTAALAGNAEGMYNYAILLLKGQGVTKDIPEAVRWLEKATAMPESDLPFKKNAGIADAMSSLGNLYDGGIYYPQDKNRAREYWERAAERGNHAGANNLGVCLSHGTHGAKVDLPRARDFFRQSAEAFNNEAMSNLADLHASINEYETAARWANAAVAFGLLPAAEDAAKYRELAKMRKQVPDNVNEKIDEFKTMLRENSADPTAERTNRVPSLEELRAVDTPYGRRLLSARSMMVQASEYVYPCLESMVTAVQLAAKAYRIDDGHLVFTSDEMADIFGAASFLLDAGVLLNADIALCLKTDASSLVSFWKSMQQKFPSDLTITSNAAMACMFDAYPGADKDLAVRLFDRAFSLLSHPNDDSDPTTMALLYNTGAAFYLTNRHSRAQALLSRFLKHAPSDGHRKAADAHFILGCLVLKNSNAVKSGRKRKAQLQRLEAEARQHLREGIVLEERVPGFLREGQASTHRKCLEGFLNLVSSLISPDASKSSQESECGGVKRGGELIPGTRRHPKLRANKSILSTSLRKNIAMFAELQGRFGGTNMRRVASSVKPPRSSTDHVSPESAVPATIDELFSALKDQVYKERSVECIVVSTPISTGSSFQMIVEDSQREPARLAIYNSTPSLVKQLVPGRVLVLLNPYVRIAGDASIMLRVDNPSDTLQVKAKHSICWVCSVEDQSDQRLKHCAKCNEAFYCSKKCQKQDWTVYSHRYVCATRKK